MTTERLIQTDGVELATQAFGDAADPPVLLIMGNMASMLWWPEAFCQGLADQGRFVIRYDNRDTGRSTHYPPGQPGYTLNDLADDAIRILDAYGLARAHLAGFSVGGMTGQLAALQHPDRVSALTLISSSPFDRDLPPPLDATEPAQEAPAATGPNLSNREDAIAYLVEEGRAIAGPAHPFDEADMRDLAGRDFDRALNYASIMNHTIMTVGEAWAGKLSQITAPVTVIHNTADPVYPLDHGIALAAALGDAPLVRLEGTGHELHPATWDEVIAAILATGEPRAR